MPRKKPRNYKKEYREFHGKPAQIKARSRRVMARRKAMKDGAVKKGDSKEVHHARPYAKGRTRVMSRKRNRQIGKPGRKRK